MKKAIVCVYCEGNDTKFAVVTKDNGILKIHRVASVDVYKPQARPDDNLGAGTLLEADSSVQLNTEGGDFFSENSTIMETMVSTELQGVKLSQCQFIPILTEPSIFYQVISKRTTGSNQRTSELISRGMHEKKLDQQNFGLVELADGSSLNVFLTQDIGCFRMINRLANYHQKRYFKIVSVKSAEISLAEYVAKKKKFFPDDYSLIVYIGKEYSKLIFLHGRKLKHIGATLDVGVVNLHTYDVYFSKILLEMENGNIPNLDNIVVCGEDDSENLILSFYGTFPEANVSRLEFENTDVSELKDEQRMKISSFSVPIAVATEYFEEQKKEFKGINLLPNYIKEEQKFFQFGWHGYLVLPLLFLTAFYITYQILSNQVTINKLSTEILHFQDLKRQNLEVLTQIETLDARISGFDQTQTILDTITVGADVWTKLLADITLFNSQKRNFWLRNFNADTQGGVVIEGHSQSRSVLTEFASSFGEAILKNINYDPIREEETYRFSIEYKTTSTKVDTIQAEGGAPKGE